MTIPLLKIDATLDDMRRCEDWSSAFLFGGSGDKEETRWLHSETAPPVAVGGARVSNSPFGLDDVEVILASAVRDGDYGEWEDVALGRLQDGRFFSLSSWCDTSGWG